jgi:hypothetical protein
LENRKRGVACLYIMLLCFGEKVFRPLSFRFLGIAGKVIPIDATGGAEIFTETVGEEIYKIHIFKASGTFIVNRISNRFNSLEILSVAGGGAGGAADNEFEGGGGGGAGGFRQEFFNLVSEAAYSVLVGAGGAGRGGRNNRVAGLPGLSSSFASIQSAGGGGGLAPNDGVDTIADGGSGGGGTGRSSRAGLGNVPPTTPPQGYNGFRPGTGGQLTSQGGGGGGAAAASTSREGGVGRATSIITPQNALSRLVGNVSGSVLRFSKGGWGGNGTSSTNYVAGANNTGDGGSGGYAAGERAGDPNQFMRPGANGGSGVVIVRYRIQ